jgi:hypothetical protein
MDDVSAVQGFWVRSATSTQGRPPRTSQFAARKQFQTGAIAPKAIRLPQQDRGS